MLTGFAVSLWMLGTFGQSPSPGAGLSAHVERFVEANGVRLHCLDWGGDGPAMILLTGYGAEAHVFDDFAPRFTDRFHVLAFTRRGTDPSERTPSGYDLDTLTADLESFMDIMGVQRAHLVGHSFAGTEMTEFAQRHPQRVSSLVYLDAALDLAAAEAVLTDAPIPQPRPSPGSPYAQILTWSASYTPDFTQLRSRALAFYAFQEENPATPTDADESLRRRMNEYWNQRWLPMVRRTVSKFEHEVRNGRAVVLPHTSHYLFRDRTEEVVREMQRFYTSIEE